MTPPATATAEALPTLPDAVARRGLDEAQWRTLMNSLYPGAKSESVLMVVDYCRARRLDPLKKPCHIVPMEVRDARNNKYEWRDVVMPGIYEHRTTAVRTGLYLGHSEPTYGPLVTVVGVEAPEWCAMTMYRWNPELKMRAEFPVKVIFAEVVALNRDGVANARWTRAPIQMLTKCTEAAGLREGFPEELGGETTFEEMDGQQRLLDAATTASIVPMPLRASAVTGGDTPTSSPASASVAGTEPVAGNGGGAPSVAVVSPQPVPVAEGSDRVTALHPQAWGWVADLASGIQVYTREADIGALLTKAHAEHRYVSLTHKPKATAQGLFLISNLSLVAGGGAA